MQVFALYGVHGAGKSYIARPVAEDLGLLYVQADAMEIRGASVQKVSPFARQCFFVLSALAGYVNALDLARREKPVLLDFGPYQTDPYIRWWVKNLDEQKRLLNMLYSAAETIDMQYDDVEVHHIFFVIEKGDGLEKVRERIMRRDRPEAIRKEEANAEYIRFIDKKLKEIRDRLEREEKLVHTVPAELNIRDRVGALWSIVEGAL